LTLAALALVVFGAHDSYPKRRFGRQALQTFLSAKDAVCPPRTSLTAILFRCILLTAIGMKWPSGSGPNINVSFRRISPRNAVPDTTVPTPCKLHHKTDLTCACNTLFFYESEQKPNRVCLNLRKNLDILRLKPNVGNEESVRQRKSSTRKLFDNVELFVKSVQVTDDIVEQFSCRKLSV